MIKIPVQVITMVWSWATRRVNAWIQRRASREK